MSTLALILYVVYATVACVVGCLGARSTFGAKGERRPATSVQPGNPGSAVAMGVLFGLCWLVYLTGFVLYWLWTENGLRSVLKDDAERKLHND